MRLGILLLFVWTVLLTIFLPQLAFSKVMQATGFPSVNMVTVTGRAAIQHEDTVDEARDLALEDAEQPKIPHNLHYQSSVLT